MKLIKFCEWLGIESVRIEINKKRECGFEFLRIVHAFRRHLNDKEKKKYNVQTRIRIMELNIESMYDKLEWIEIKKALKMVKNGESD